MKTLISCILMLALSACGVPDLVATGVKAYEKDQDQKNAKAQAQQSQAQPQYKTPSASSTDDPPPPVSPPPSRDSITVEKLR